MAGFEKRMNVRKHFVFSIDFVVQYKIRYAPRERMFRIHDVHRHLMDDKITW